MAIPANLSAIPANAEVSAIKLNKIEAGMVVAKYGCPIDPVPVRPQPPIVRYGGPIKPAPDNSKADVPVIQYDSSDIPAKETNTYFNNRKLHAEGLSPDVMNYFENKRIMMENKFYK